MTDTRALTGARKKRDIPNGSITRLSNRITDLEANPDVPGTNEWARQWLTKLDTLDSEFKTFHFEVIDTVDDQSGCWVAWKRTSRTQQHDDEVATLMFHIQHLITYTSSVPTFTPDTHNSDLEKATNRRGCLDYNILLAP